MLRAQLADDLSFADLLQQYKEVSLGAYAHQDVPFERLVQELHPARDLSRPPLVQVLFSLHNERRDERLEGDAGPGKRRKLLSAAATSKFDITWNVTKRGPGGLIRGWSSTPPICSTRRRSGRMVGHYRTLLSTSGTRPEACLAELPLLGEPERRTLLVEWNDTVADFPHACAHQLFEAQVERTPDAVAVVSAAGAVLVSRARRASQPARPLPAWLRRRARRARGAVPPARPRAGGGACSASLKAGGACVAARSIVPAGPLGLDARGLPPVPVVVSDERTSDDLPAAGAVVRLDADWQTIAGLPTSTPTSGAEPSSLAYVIYTSGSTGKPKGVLVPHRGLVSYLWWARGAYASADGRGTPVHTSIAFDLTVTSLFSPLLSGEPVVLVPDEGGIDALAATLTERGDFSLVKLTPAHLELLSRMVPPAAAAGVTRAFVIGGEALSWDALAFWRRHAPRTRLINEYGPTEAVVGCAVFEATGAGEQSGAVPIGRPIANTRLYVLDRRGEPTPIGVPGELYIGGAGVARGYLNRPDLTAQRFVEDPFAGEAGGRLYRTGDLCRWLPSGDLVFLGRLDHQVKLRGFRIELGEIESNLLAHATVSEAVVVAREDTPGNKRLVAYVVGAEDAAPAPLDLRAFLADRLPDYMLPAAVVVLAAMPLTANGKVDREALPAPDVAVAAEGSFVAPRTPTEEVIASIWQGAIGIPRVGVTDDFFELGGHSLLAMQIMAQVTEALHVELQLATLFELKTVAGLAAIADAVLQGRAAPPESAGFEEGEL